VQDYETAVTYYQDASSCLSKAINGKYSINCYAVLCLQYDKYLHLILQYQELLAQKPASNAEEKECQHKDIDLLPIVGEPISSVQSNVIPERSSLLQHVEDDHRQLFQREPDSLLQFLNPVPNPDTRSRSQKLPKTMPVICGMWHFVTKSLACVIISLACAIRILALPLNHWHKSLSVVAF